MTRTIAVDFDGTICTNKFPLIGDPNNLVIETLQREKEQGSKIILWTCREGKLLDKALAACEEWGLTFDAVNESTEEWKEFYGNDPRKPGADEYWDDRAVVADEYGVGHSAREDVMVRLCEACQNQVRGLKNRLDKAEEKIKTLIADGVGDILCEYCVHSIRCPGKDCPGYEHGTSVYEG